MSRDTTLLDHQSITVSKTVQENEWVELNDVQGIVFVLMGTMDAYIQLKDDRGIVSRQFLGHLVPNDGACGVHMVHSVSFALKGTSECQIMVVSFSGIGDLADQKEVARALGQWFSSVSKLLPSKVNQKAGIPLSANKKYSIKKGDYVTSDQDLIWLLNESKPLKIEMNRRMHEAKYPFPLAFNQMLQLQEALQLKALSIQQILAKRSLRRVTKQLYQLVFDHFKQDVQAVINRKTKQVGTLKLDRQEMVSKSVQSIVKTIEDKTEMRTSSSDNPITQACLCLASYYGYKIEVAREFESIEAFFRYYLVPFRRVRLEADWINKSTYGFISYHKSSAQPVVVLPKAAHTYQAVHGDERVAITGKNKCDYDWKVFQVIPFQKKLKSSLSMIDFIKLTRSQAPLLLGVSLLTGSLAFILPMVIRWGVDDMFRYHNVAAFGGVLAVACITTFGFMLWRLGVFLYFREKAGELDFRLTGRFFYKLFHDLPLGTIQNITAGKIINRFHAIQDLKFMSHEGVVQHVYRISLMAWSSVAILVLNPLLGLTIFFYGLLVMGVLCSMKGRIDRCMRYLFNSEEVLHGHVFEMLQGLEKIKYSAAQASFFRRWASSFNVYIRQKAKALLVQAYAKSVMTFILPGSLCIGLLGIGYFNVSMSLGGIVAFFAAAYLFSDALVAIARASFQTSMYKANAQSYLTETDWTEVQENKNQLDSSHYQGGLAFHQCAFSYHANRDILNDISFKLEPGESVAIVGRSGSGKSSIIRLLLGFESPQRGSIYYDNLSHKDVDYTQIRKKIGVVLQDSSLLSGDIYTNITSGVYFPETKIWKVLDLVQISDEIKAMPMGLHTLITPQSQVLSQSQKQRIMLARAIISDPRLLVLDEAMQAIEPQVRDCIFDRLSDLQMTVVLVSHRLNAIQKMDRVFVLEKGVILEEGTYGDLIRQQGVLYELMHRQF